MVFITKTSRKTMEIYAYIQQREYLQPYILAKISIALAIKNKCKYDGNLADTAGLDLNRQTITGDNDLLFKKLIEMNEGHSIKEEDYFPDYVKAYMDKGAELLEQEYKYSKDIYKHLVNLENSI